MLCENEKFKLVQRDKEIDLIFNNSATKNLKIKWHQREKRKQREFHEGAHLICDVYYSYIL